MKKLVVILFVLGAVSVSAYEMPTFKGRVENSPILKSPKFEPGSMITIKGEAAKNLFMNLEARESGVLPNGVRFKNSEKMHCSLNETIISDNYQCTFIFDKNGDTQLIPSLPTHQLRINVND